MGQVLPGSARTTAAIRAAIQRRSQSLQSLARRHGINPKTVAKWRKRTSTQEAVRGSTPASTGWSPEEEAGAVAFRQHTPVPLDDGRYALQATIPRLTRSALHRLFQRHGRSRLPLAEDGNSAPKNGNSAPKKKVKAYPIGYLPVDLAEGHTEQGKLYLFGAIDRTRKVAFAELQPRATKMLAAEFLRRVLAALPYKGHTVLTDNGTQVGNRPHQRYAGRHIFDRVCDEHGLEHRFPKPAPPWPKGQVERLNRTLKEATVLRSHYETTEQLNEPLQAFLLAYHHAKRLKTLRGLTPHEFVCAQHQKSSAIFTDDPTHLMLGLYT